jgi:membrane-associated protease RseP (regulator of RpoE activity)
MVSFFGFDWNIYEVIDISFWWAVAIFLVILFSRKKNLRKKLDREGIIFMYRTQIGVKFINYVGDNFKKILDSLKYVIVSVGLVLMGIVIWMLGKSLSIYILRPEVTETIKAPPIAPLIPYFPKIFGLEAIFPSFYITYFVISIAIVAFVHEFSHGIFMRRFGVKIKSTGTIFIWVVYNWIILGFFRFFHNKIKLHKTIAIVLTSLLCFLTLLFAGTIHLVFLILLIMPLLGAFVEEERTSFEKKKNLEQMTILGAGVFANIIFALIFYGLYVLFFLTSFTASGYDFDSYSYSKAPLDLIDDIGVDIGTMDVLVGGNLLQLNLTEVKVDDRTFYIKTETKEFILGEENLSNFGTILFDKSPALENNLKGIIIKADDTEIINQNSLGEFLKNTRPGDSIKFTTLYGAELTEYNLVLGTHPDPEINIGYIGIAHFIPQPKGILQNFFIKFMSFKESSTHYEPTWNGANFFLMLFWWIMIINLLVALFNMLPLGILDGGRFFYLALLSFTGSEKFSKGAFRFMTYVIGFLFLSMMLIWFIRVVL